MSKTTCPICLKQYKNYKSWHRHKTTKHPQMIVPNNTRSYAAKAEYNVSPKLCANCNKTIPYGKRFNSFCSQHCSGVYNNKAILVSTKQKRIQTWRNKLGLLKRDQPRTPRNQYRYNKTHVCITCDTPFQANGTAHKYCSPQCNTSKFSKHIYRQACKFKLSPKTHPTLYNFQLIQQYGWYAPTNSKRPTNLTGVCWDHLYRIEDGYKNNINPSIIRHPANAELVPWYTNRERTKSLITYIQLLQRIEQWEQGQFNLPTFFHT